MAPDSADFEFEGSWRDIYVFGATISDWRSVIDALRRWNPAPEFSIFGEASKLPERVEDIFHGEWHGAFLSFEVGKVRLNCHFHDEDPIEFHLDPREVAGPDEVDALVGFMEMLGRMTGKIVALTMENCPEAMIFRYSPESDKVGWIASSGDGG